MFETVAQTCVFDEVGRIRQSRLAGPMILDLQSAGAGYVVNVVTANFRVRIAVAVE